MPNHPDHFCANNDRECTCKCYDEGFEAGKEAKLATTYQSSRMYLIGFKEGKAQERKELIEYLESLIQEERFSGTPYAINKAITHLKSLK